MADSHTDLDPNVAPTRQQVKERFGSVAELACYALALVAGIAGLAAGLIFVND